MTGEFVAQYRRNCLEIATPPVDTGAMEQRQLITETDIATSIIASGIADEPVTHLVEHAMQRLVLAGVPLHRMQVGFRILHPLFDGMSVTWTEEAGVAVTYYDHIDVDGSEFRLSPFYYMLANGQTELRLRIDRDPDAMRFPVLMDFKAKGVTDYLALIVSFGGAPMTPETPWTPSCPVCGWTLSVMPIFSAAS